ncbi:15458_t:CDS:2, partial [Funneliformis caledonium]
KPSSKILSEIKIDDSKVNVIQTSSLVQNDANSGIRRTSTRVSRASLKKVVEAANNQITTRNTL